MPSGNDIDPSKAFEWLNASMKNQKVEEVLLETIGAKSPKFGYHPFAFFVMKSLLKKVTYSTFFCKLKHKTHRRDIECVPL